MYIGLSGDCCSWHYKWTIKNDQPKNEAQDIKSKIQYLADQPNAQPKTQ